MRLLLALFLFCLACIVTEVTILVLDALHILVFTNFQRLGCAMCPNTCDTPGVPSQFVE